MNRQRILTLLCLTFTTLATSIFFTKIAVLPTVAQTLPSSVLSEVNDAIATEKQGKDAYKIGRIDESIAAWMQALQGFRERGDKFAQVRISSNLALAYQQLGKWHEAENAIKESFSILESFPDKNSQGDRARLLAQTFNNQGILQLALGKSQQALDSWQHAEQAYKQVKDDLGVIRSQINQVNAWQSLGMYRRALQIFDRIGASLEQQPNTVLKVAGMRTFGHILAKVGDLEKAESILNKSLNSANQLPLERAETLLELGNLARSRKNSQAALDYYQQALQVCHNLQAFGSIVDRIQLAKLSLAVELDRLEDVLTIWQDIANNLRQTPADRANIYNKIYLGRNLILLKQKGEKEPEIVNRLPNSQEIAAILTDAIEEAQNIEDKRAEAYATGCLAEIYERDRQWEKAQQLTEQALFLAQTINAPEIAYLWEWQLGRIWQAQNNSELAIAAYTEAVNLLKSLSKDLVAIDRNLQFSFQESVEPVYRELVSLLLRSNARGEISQENLVKARETIESLQLAELNNFFREACLNVRSVKLDEVDKGAAAIYPIILRDRLEVILSLPNQPLRHYTTFISATELEKTIEEFKRSLVIRSQRFFYEPAQKLYNMSIAPALKDLQEHQIKTLVFVLDGSLRNVPMSALYDGKQYLIEQYGIVLNPGFQLISPHPLQNIELKILAAGLTQAKDGFPALTHVNDELKAIENKLSSTVLLDRDFTSDALGDRIEYSDFPIVHIATHGQFSSTLADTFLLAWNQRIDITELDRILQGRVNSNHTAIELLVLSACETASGDKKAALGLAGTAVKAGARSTVATLWSVNDRATAELMNHFYEQITKKHTTKAEALRQAQIALLKDPWYKHPFYWSSYVLVGNWL
ncbi:MAG: CHAT domain-containing protein [Xenococcaceae cyanobacterium]